MAAERISLTAHPIVPKGADIGSANGKARFNPVLWLVNRGQDLPSWLALDSTRVSLLTLSLPDYETRLEAARHVGNLFAGYDEGTDEARTKFAKDFAQMTDGLSLVAMTDIAQIADRQDIGFRDVDDAVQSYKVGVTENPWKKDYLRERIANALPFIEERVRGPAAGGHQDDRHPDALGDGPDRRAGALVAATGRAACCSSRDRPAWARPSSRRRSRSSSSATTARTSAST